MLKTVSEKVWNQTELNDGHSFGSPGKGYCIKGLLVFAAIDWAEKDIVRKRYVLFPLDGVLPKDHIENSIYLTNPAVGEILDIAERELWKAETSAQKQKLKQRVKEQIKETGVVFI
jgi:hypothetical protein